MDIRLLNRTTRSVTPTEVGEHLLRTVAPRLDEIAAEIQRLRDLQQKPAGTVRITAIDWVADHILWPRLSDLVRTYPDIKIEISSSYRLADIVEERFDFGVRSGAQVAKDMIAVRISPDFGRSIVGSPAYFARNPPPESPRDLMKHVCIALRLSTKGGIYDWPLKNGDQELRVKVSGQLTFNSSRQILQAALDGCGLALSPEPLAAPYVAAGRLRAVLPQWCPTVAGFHLYYPSRRQPSRAFSLVLDALRYRQSPPGDE
jgi:DNA-binding transcriptional LysR family regulator